MFSPGSHLSLNNSSVMHSFVDSFFEGKKALVKERLMDSVRVIVDGLFEEMVGQVKEMIMLPPKESAGTTSAEPSTPKLPVSTSTVLPSQEHQQHQDGRCRSASPPATVPRLMEEPVVDGVDVAEKKAQNSVAATTAEESLKTNDKSDAATTTTTTPLPPPPTTTEDGDDLKKVAKKSLASATTAISAPSPPTTAADCPSPSIAANGDSNDNSAASASAAAEKEKKEESLPLLKTRANSAPTTTAKTKQYKPAANAWRPGRPKARHDPVEAETEALLKSVRAILNKLTPQNYHTLLEQFKALKIDSRNRLSRVIGLIFDKAVKEPSFVVQYAGFCSELVHIKVVETNEAGETADVKFKNLLIEKCQETFFREMYSDIENYEERQREIEQCTDEKKKKELEDIMDDDKKLSFRRSIGNIKLIAELFKLNMLNVRIMFSCMQRLISQQHEEYVEALCVLITNIGGNLSSAIEKNKLGEQEAFDEIFAKLTAIQRQEEGALKVCSRIRFTILELLDLRKNNWIGRRKKNWIRRRKVKQWPKTIAYVHENMDQAERRKNMEAVEFKVQL